VRLGPKIKRLSGPDQQAQSYDLTLEAYSFCNPTLYIAAYPSIYNRHTQHLPYHRWSAAIRKSSSSSLFRHMWVISSPSLPPSVHRHPQVFIFSFVPPYVSDFYSVPTSTGPPPSASLHLLLLCPPYVSDFFHSMSTFYSKWLISDVCSNRELHTTSEGELNIDVWSLQ
jgi:hypothetical protein